MAVTVCTSEDTVTTLINSTRPNRAARGGRHRSTRPRTLNLVDLENLVGGDVDAPRVRETGNMSHSLDDQYRLAFENRKLRAILLFDH